MKLESAIYRAKKFARLSLEEYYIISDEDGGYAVCSEYDLDTFFLGQTPVFVVEPDGSVLR